MTNETKINANETASPNKDSWRDWFAASLGVRGERKAEIYLDLSKSATLRDTSYWLQILFSSGIAILGMVLNSTAVVIGAMLISPLMGPILAGGLAFASGDVILGGRAIVNIVLSCALAGGFAMLLVTLLPSALLTLPMSIVFSEHADKLLWVGSILTSCQLLLGLLWLCREKRLTIGYSSLCLLLSTYGSFIVNALMRM